jgi:L-asparaginase II
MMEHPTYEPVFEFTRGEIRESLHYGAIAVVDNQGQLSAWVGDPENVTYLRSTAKPFQALPFVESGGIQHFGLSLRELALICASHSGTDEHVEVASSIQAKVGVGELDLMCGIHAPSHGPTADALRLRGESPTPNRNNCSGKHSGMLAFAQMQGWVLEHYIDPIHPVQQKILQAFAEMCGLAIEDVELGIDGCSAPNFAIPLRNAAWGYARLCDPSSLSTDRADACRTIVQAMTTFPDMVGGPDRFDTLLMQVAGGKILTKGGAEGYQGIGLMPGALGPGSPALGITLKIADGDLSGRARPAVTLEVLRQLGALTKSELEALSRFGPSSSLINHRKLLVGEARPIFHLHISQPLADLISVEI